MNATTISLSASTDQNNQIISVTYFHMLKTRKDHICASFNSLYFSQSKLTEISYPPQLVTRRATINTLQKMSVLL